jgi:conjugal transfer pilus assembly protein TraA
MKKLMLNAAAFSAFLFASSAVVHAGTTGTEFQAAYDMLVGWIGGYLGKIIALAFFVVGMFMGVVRQNLMAAGVSIACAFAMVITPTILDGLLTATVTADTVVIVAPDAVVAVQK